MSIDLQIDDYIKQKRYRQINSVLVCKDGELISERYYNQFDVGSTNPIKSIAKSIMSIAFGIALDRGLILSIDEPISKYIPEFREGRDPFHKKITMEHLLTMSSGIYWNGGVHYHCPMLAQIRRSDDWISHIADCRVTDIPASKFIYKEWDIMLLAKVLDVACGDMYDFIYDNIYDLLEIKSERWYKTNCGLYYSVADGDEGERESFSNLTARDMIKIGQLLLHEGAYNDKQIVSVDYLRKALSPSRVNKGYGYLFWRGNNYYLCKGYGGQNIYLFPEKDLIIVTQATPTSRGMSYDDVIWFVERLC